MDFVVPEFIAFYSINPVTFHCPLGLTSESPHNDGTLSFIFSSQDCYEYFLSYSNVSSFWSCMWCSVFE